MIKAYTDLSQAVAQEKTFFVSPVLPTPEQCQTMPTQTQLWLAALLKKQKNKTIIPRKTCLSVRFIS